MQKVFLIACLLVHATSVFSQKYLKTKGITQEIKNEYIGIDNMSYDTLKTGFDKRFEEYKNTGNLVYLYLCNNYANELVKYPEGFDVTNFEKLRVIAENNGDTLTDEYADIYAEEALYYFYRREREKSQEYNVIAYNLLKKIELENYLPLVNIVYKIGYIYYTMDELDKAVYYAKLCILEAKKHNVKVLESAAYLIITRCTKNSDPEIAESFAKKGLMIANTAKLNQTVKKEFHTQLAVLYSYFLKKYDLAIQYADSSIQYFEKEANSAEAFINLYCSNAISYNELKDTIGFKNTVKRIDSLLNTKELKNHPSFFQSLNSVANIYYMTGQHQKAQQYYQRSMEEYQAKKYPDDSPDISGLYTDQGLMFIYLKDFSAFDSLYAESRFYFTKNKPLDTLINNLDYQRMESLLKYYNYGLFAICKNPEKNHLIDSALNLFELQYKLASAIFARFDFNTNTVNDQTKRLKSSSDAILNSEMLSNMSAEQIEKFWMISSTIKSFDLVNKKLSKQFSYENNIDFRKLKSRLLSCKETDSLYRQYFDEYILFCMDNHLDAIIRNNNPYDPKILTDSYKKIKEIFNLNTEILVLDLYKTDSAISIFSIRGGRLDYDIMQIENELNNDFSELERDVKTQNYHSNKAFRKLEGFLSNIIGKNDKIKKISIIADGELLMFPFELMQYKGNSIISKYEISYNYSPYLMLESIHNTKNKKDFLLAVAPVFENASSSIGLALRDDVEAMEEENEDEGLFRDNRNLAPLPYTKNEVETIQSIFINDQKATEVYIGDKATEKACRSGIEKYDIIHFATHGYSSKKEPSFSRLILAFDEESNVSSENDAFLFMDEIYELSLNADLVVLSACKTGVGKIVDGEGVMALPRGFIYAGVPNVIASLWKVHDEKTKDLMVSFYKHFLEDKVSYSEALRLAKLDCIEKGFLPIDWAGFVLIGN